MCFTVAARTFFSSLLFDRIDYSYHSQSEESCITEYLLEKQNLPNEDEFIAVPVRRVCFRKE